MPRENDRLIEVRRRYGRMMAVEAQTDDPRIEQVFASVPREAFLPPPPWSIMAAHNYVETSDDDPAQLYVNALVALDADRGINNGEPSLHAAWLAAVAPRPGEVVSHIGAGTGYYTAMLSLLVQPGGAVRAYEIDALLSEMARRNLGPYANVRLVEADGVTAELPSSDVVYVSAGVAAPPAGWLRSLKPGGRLIFPWRPAEHIGLAVLATRTASGFAARMVGNAWFIPCKGASDTSLTVKAPGPRTAQRVRSLVLTAALEPDDSAVAIYPDVWFSADDV